MALSFDQQLFLSAVRVDIIQFHEQQLEDSSQLSTIHNISDVSRAQSPISVASTASTASTSSLQSEEERPKGKTKKARSKSADWTDNETQDLLEAWGPKYNQLRSTSQKEKITIWNEIYSSYKNAFPESQRTLQQIKKRHQNLEDEYKHLKQRTQKTGEAGIKIIKDGFPYFDYFDELMGHRDCVNPTKMAFEGSSILTSTEQEGGSVESKDVLEESSPRASNPSTHSGKKKADDKRAEKGCHKGKRQRRDEPEPSVSSAGEFQTAVMEMWKRSIEQDNERFECSAEMFCEAQNKQMDQTNATPTGFKDIFKDLLSK